jgi:uncharacterized protein (TIGR02996 family)
MNDGDALLAAIIANPDDDTPRLVYADWLQENGQPERAEFIRVAVRRARTAKGTRDYRKLFGRELELLTRHREEWSAPFRPWAAFENLVFRRGFVEEAHLQPDVYLAHSGELLSAAPVREVWVNNAAPLVLELARAPRPPHVRLRAGEHSPPPSWFPGEEPVDLLPPGSAGAEPYLQRDTWLILAYGTYDGADYVTMRRFLRCAQQLNIRPGGVANYALLPLDDPEQFAAWCSLPDPWVTPHWVWLGDGTVTQVRTGLDPPPDWEARWETG